MNTRPKFCLVTTSPIVVRFFLLPHLRRLVLAFDVTLVVNSECDEILGDLAGSLHTVIIKVEREISPWHDCLAVAKLAALFRRERFDAVVTIAPKAGLLGGIGAFLARTPYRCHIFQGEVWASRHGIMRWMLRKADQVTATLATEVLVVSATEREFLIKEGILTAARSAVLGGGSISGVDTQRFAPSPATRHTLRAQSGIPQSAIVLLYLGRLHRDKGILDLVTAFARLAGQHPDLHLAIIGPDESGLEPSIRNLTGTAFADRLHFHGLSTKPEAWMASSDIVCLPSYREGFPSVILEAGAAELPMLASRIYGIEDALIDNVTGLLHQPADPSDLVLKLSQLLNDPMLRVSLGKAGRKRVLEQFEQSRVVEGYATHFAKACNVDKGAPSP